MSESSQAGGAAEDARRQERLRSALKRISHRILILSGKGGVGKTTIAVNLAAALAHQGLRVGLLDVDIHGPSVPRMLGLSGRRMESDGSRMMPVEVGSLKVVSIGFLLAEPRQAVIWRGPLKMAVIRQFLEDVDWGDLDWLVVDCPPGTGDEPLSVVQLLGDADGAVVVTTPQEVALSDVRRCITFCCQVGLDVLGIVENMSGYVCPKCGEFSDVFGAGGRKALAEEMEVPFLCAVPLERAIVEQGDLGLPAVADRRGGAGGEALKGLAQLIRRRLDGDASNGR